MSIIAVIHQKLSPNQWLQILQKIRNPISYFDLNPGASISSTLGISSYIGT